MKPRHTIPRLKRCSTNRYPAFTIIELLTVITAVALLCALAIPLMASSHEKSGRAQCKSNLQQVYLAAQLFADENNNSLPAHTASGNFLWDLPSASADALTESGARRQIMYCPTSTQALSVDAFWNFSSTRRIVGYSCLFQRIGFSGSLIAPKEFVSKINQPMPGSTLAESEFIADVVISDLAGSNFDIAILSAITLRGSYGSSHMQGQRPAGGNILFLDGHVGWRPFNQMQVRYLDSAGRARWWF
jgi:prepilin-type processing-associated H-X9-DG protein